MRNSFRKNFNKVCLVMIMLLGVCSVESKANAQPPLALFQSGTTRDVIFYFLPANTTAKQIKGKTAQQLDGMSLDHRSYKLASKSTHVQPVPAPSFKIAIARQGNSVLKKNLGKKFALCGPIHEGDGVYIFTKKRLGFDAGTSCKITKNDPRIKKQEEKHYKPLPVTPEMREQARKEMENDPKLVAAAVVGHFQKGKGAILQIIEAKESSNIGKLAYLHPDNARNLKERDVVGVTRLVSREGFRKGCENFDTSCSYGAFVAT